MRKIKLVACFLLGLLTALSQTDRGTITGTIADPTGAVVANASIAAKNVATDQVYSATSTQTGHYTLPQLPAGSYALPVNVQGFKRCVRQCLSLAPTQTRRIDVALEVGSSRGGGTVTGEASLLK